MQIPKFWCYDYILVWRGSYCPYGYSQLRILTSSSDRATLLLGFHMGTLALYICFLPPLSNLCNLWYMICNWIRVLFLFSFGYTWCFNYWDIWKTLIEIVLWRVMFLYIIIQHTIQRIAWISSIQTHVGSMMLNQSLLNL